MNETYGSFNTVVCYNSKKSLPTLKLQKKRDWWTLL